MPFTLHVENYRGIRKATFTPSGVCALVGPNGAGKSTLLRVPELFRHALRHGFEAALEHQGGRGSSKNFAADRTAQVRLQIKTVDEVNGWTLEFNPIDGKAFTWIEQFTVAGLHMFTRRNLEAVKIGAWELAEGDTRLALGALYDVSRSDDVRSIAEPIRIYRVYGDYDVRKLQEAGSRSDSDTWLHPSGLNVFTVLRNWRDKRADRARYDFVINGLQRMFPGHLSDLEFESAADITFGRFVTERFDETLPPLLMANGVLHGLLHLTALAGTTDGAAIGIDEPETSLHPAAIRELLKLMREWSKKHRVTVILATHSPVVLDQFKEQPDQVFAMDAERGPTRLTDLEDGSWLAHFSLGELYAQGQYGGPRAAE